MVLMFAAAVVLQRPKMALVRINGVLNSTYAFVSPRNKGVAMFELVRHDKGDDVILSRCDRRMWEKTGRQRFRLDMRVPEALLGQTANLRVYILDERWTSWASAPIGRRSPRSGSSRWSDVYSFGLPLRTPCRAGRSLRAAHLKRGRWPTTGPQCTDALYADVYAESDFCQEKRNSLLDGHGGVLQIDRTDV